VIKKSVDTISKITYNPNVNHRDWRFWFISEENRKMRRLDGLMLQQAMERRSWNNADLARELKSRGYEVTNRIINKWCNGKLQPSNERIELIEQVLGHVISKAPEPRRTFNYSLVSSIAA